MSLSSDRRYLIAFSLSTLCGWMAGLFLPGGSLLGELDLTMLLAFFLPGGLVGASICGRSWTSRLMVVATLSAYVAVLAQLTGLYLQIRAQVFLPELLVPCALALLPFFWARGLLGLSTSSMHPARRC